MKSMVFAVRNFKELMRDPLSWVFCLGFPIVMLILMTIVNNSIPAEAGMKLFEIQSLGPAVAIFGLTFIMLFSSMLISGDRKEAFLLRIFTSPMKSSDYIIGYICPMIVLAIGQYIITIIASLVVAAASDVKLNIGYMFMSMLFSLPAVIMFIAFGIFFGTILNKNAAPGICSIIISMAGLLGGIWMDVDALGGALEKICRALPFYPAVTAARLAFIGEFGNAAEHMGVVSIWAVVLLVVAIVTFKKKMTF